MSAGADTSTPSLTEPPPSASVQPASGEAAPPKRKRRLWPFGKGERKPKPTKRPLLWRLFGLSLWGAIKLVVLCVLVGFVVLALQFDPASPEFGARQAIATFWRNAIAAGAWAAQNFWKPALAGAAVVLPIWVLWRLISLPFRR